MTLTTGHAGYRLSTARTVGHVEVWTEDAEHSRVTTTGGRGAADGDDGMGALVTLA